MNLMTRVNILTMLSIVCCSLDYISPNIAHASVRPQEAIETEILRPIPAETLEERLHNAIIYFEITDDPNQIAAVMDDIRSGYYIEITRAASHELLTKVIFWSGEYLSRIAILNLTGRSETHPEIVTKCTQLVNACNNFLRFFLELNGGYNGIDDLNEMGNTLLHEALIHNNPDALRILLDHNAQINIMDLYRRTPYALAINLSHRFPLCANTYQSIFDVFHDHGVTA